MVQSIPPGPFFIVSRLNGRVIDVEGASTKDGAKIVVWSKKEFDNDNQLWEYRHGFFVNIHSGKVLDVKGGEVESNAAIIQYERKDINEAQENQIWLIDHSGFIHTSANPNLVLDIK
ncbi:carbohydrate-binding module family 13 protein [Backusella circina FSU 941]|nr:carbohydrate-binding module family 13 protein [Backusella circina FSU 941]